MNVPSTAQFLDRLGFVLAIDNCPRGCAHCPAFGSTTPVSRAPLATLEHRLASIAAERACHGWPARVEHTVHCWRLSDPLDYTARTERHGIATAADLAVLWREHLHQGLYVRAPAGTVPWWGWRGRAHRITQVTPTLRIRWCWTTIADHERRAHLTDPEGLHAEQAALVVNWPRMREHYAPQARAEIRDLADRLTRHGRRPTDHSLVTQARILTDPPGATTT